MRRGGGDSSHGATNLEKAMAPIVVAAVLRKGGSLIECEFGRQRLQKTNDTDLLATALSIARVRSN
jgi:hypothetical protein